MGTAPNPPSGQGGSETGVCLPTPLVWVSLVTGETVPYSLFDPIPKTARVLPGDPGACPQFLAWLRQEVTGEPRRLQRFFRAALRKKPRELLLAPGVRDKGDFLAFWRVLSAIFGELSVRVRRDCWTRWPDHFWGSDLAGLDQAWLACLLPVEGWERFPQRSVRQMLSDSRRGFVAAADGRIVKMPRIFIYPEALGKVERLDEGFNWEVLLLPPPRENVIAHGPEEWLDEEAGAILAWLFGQGDEPR